MRNDLIGLLQCAKCHGRLEVRADGLRCQDCQILYPLINQAVCFVDTDSIYPAKNIPDSLLVEVKNKLKHYQWFYNILVYVFGTSNAGVSPAAFLEKYVSSEKVAINLGAGPQKRRKNTLQVDLYAFPEIDIVADLGSLPFKNDSVDAVFCTSVLEHVMEPQNVLNEIFRILKPGGLCYLTTPFIYPYHSSPHDYTRWTLYGIRSFLARCGISEVASGLRHGPTSALVLVFVYWLGILFSFGNTSIFEIVTILGMVVLAPLAHVIDFFLNRLEVANNSASGFYYIGKKDI